MLGRQRPNIIAKSARGSAATTLTLGRSRGRGRTSMPRSRSSILSRAQQNMA